MLHRDSRMAKINIIKKDKVNRLKKLLNTKGLCAVAQHRHASMCLPTGGIQTGWAMCGIPVFSLRVNKLMTKGSPYRPRSDRGREGGKEAERGAHEVRRGLFGTSVPVFWDARQRHCWQCFVWYESRASGHCCGCWVMFWRECACVCCGSDWGYKEEIGSDILVCHHARTTFSSCCS